MGLKNRAMASKEGMGNHSCSADVRSLHHLLKSWTKLFVKVSGIRFDFQNFPVYPSSFYFSSVLKGKFLSTQGLNVEIT